MLKYDRVTLISGKAVSDHVVAVVGIGAPAGGVDSLAGLLGDLPAGIQMSFVYVESSDLPLDGSFKDILSGKTSMPVLDAADNMAVEPGHIYFCPPGRRLTVSNNTFRSEPYVKSSTHMPIDSLFFSLAGGLKSRAMGVVFPGTGTDGVLGLRAIKKCGGITFTLDGARRGSFVTPLDTDTAGHADFVMTAEKTAKELSRLAQHPYLGRIESDLDQAAGTGLNNDIQKIKDILISVNGHDFSTYKDTAIYMRIMRRLAVRNVSSVEKYAEILRHEDNEIDMLVNDILVYTRAFFRDTDTFEALEKSVFPSLVDNRRSESLIRVWVPGCATGEDVYSLAVAFMDFRAARALHFNIQIFATDISELALGTARAGFYSSNSVAGLSSVQLNNYFDRKDGGYRIKKSIREMCVFARQDVSLHPPFSRIDLLYCRNLMKYLGPAVQKKVLHALHFAVNPDGILMIGQPDSFDGFTSLFSRADEIHSVYTKNMVLRPLTMDLSLLSSFDKMPGDPRIHGPQPEHVVQINKIVDNIIVNRLSPACALINMDRKIIHSRGQISSFLESEADSASTDILKLIRPDFERALRSTVAKAVKMSAQAQKTVTRTDVSGTESDVVIEVIPVKSLSEVEPLFLVVFRVVNMQEKTTVSLKDKKQKPRKDKSEVDILKYELANTREHLQSVIEYSLTSTVTLQVANEERESRNEELLSLNEEIETAKEELQAANEDLETSNEQLETCNAELSRTNFDLLNIMSSAYLPIVLLDSTLVVRRMTAAAGGLLNVHPSDSGRKISDLDMPFDMKAVTGLVKEVLMTNRRSELKLRSTGGIWYICDVSPIEQDSGNIGIVILFKDLNSVNSALEQSEDIVRSIQYPILVLSHNLTVKSANKQYYWYFNADEDDTVGCKFYNLCGGGWDVPGLRAALRTVITDGRRLKDYEVELDLKESGRYVFELNATEIMRDNIRTNLILLSIADVTARKKLYEMEIEKNRVAAAMAESEKRKGLEVAEAYSRMEKSQTAFNNIVESSPDGIAVLSDKNILVYFNESFRIMFGDKVDSFIGEPFGIPIVDGDFAELDIVRNDGTPGNAEMRFARTMWEGEKATVVSLRDITDSVRAEAQIRHAQKMEAVGQVAAGMAHEVNNALAGIVGMAELVKRGMDQGDELDIILAESNRAGNIVRDLLMYARAETGQKSEVSLSVIIKQVQRLLYNDLKIKHINLAFESSVQVPAIFADADKIQQVITNLIINARDAMAGSGDIFLRLAAEPRWVRLEIEDTGPGIPADVMPKIFDPFFTTKGIGKGTGLGLSVAAGIIKGHGGTIVADNTGRGARFTIRIPAAGASAQPQAAANETATMAHGMKILVVDDEQYVRNFSKRLLSSIGNEVFVAVSGEDALALIEAGNSFDVVLSDQAMPGMSGVDLYDKLKAANRPEAGKFVLITGLAPREIRADIKVLPKPINGVALIQIISEIGGENS